MNIKKTNKKKTTIDDFEKIDNLLNKKLESCKIILYNIINIYKKIISLIDDFQELIIKLGNQQFSLISNIANTTQIILDSIELLYNNIIILFSKKINKNQLINYSDKDIKKGYNIGYFNVDINKIITITFINSYKIKMAPFGVIKLVEYNKNIDAINVVFLGSHFNNIVTEEDLMNKLSKAYNNNKITLSSLKTTCMKYIQIYNNIIKIMD